MDHNRHVHEDNQQLVLKPATSLKKCWGGYRSKTHSKFGVASPLPACDMEAVYAFYAIRSPQTQPKACPRESGIFLA